MGPIAKILSPVGNALGLFDDDRPRTPSPLPPLAAPVKAIEQRRKVKRPTIKTGPLGLQDEGTGKTLLG